MPHPSWKTQIELKRSTPRLENPKSQALPSNVHWPQRSCPTPPPRAPGFPPQLHPAQSHTEPTNPRAHASESKPPPEPHPRTPLKQNTAIEPETTTLPLKHPRSFTFPDLIIRGARGRHRYAILPFQFPLVMATHHRKTIFMTRQDLSREHPLKGSVLRTSAPNPATGRCSRRSPRRERNHPQSAPTKTRPSTRSVQPRPSHPALQIKENHPQTRTNPILSQRILPSRANEPRLQSDPQPNAHTRRRGCL